MNVIVLEGPKHIEVRLQRILNHDFGNLPVTGIAVIVAVGIGESDDKIIDLIQLALHSLSVRQGYSDGFPDDLGRSGRLALLASEDGALQGSNVSVFGADTRQVAGNGMATATFPGPLK